MSSMNQLEAEQYENAALRDQIKELKVMHLSAESELMMSEAHVERLTAENQWQANLLGNACGAVADWSDLPSDTRPAKVIEHLGRAVERLTAELAVEKATRIETEEAYGEALGWVAAAEAREEKLRETLIDRDAEIQFLRQEGLT